jgi:hypothetical protein
MTNTSPTSARYLLLSNENKWAILRERIGLLEADLFRAELQLAEALSDEERRAVTLEIGRFTQRLAPHHDMLNRAGEAWRVAPSIPDSAKPVGDHAEWTDPDPGR